MIDVHPTFKKILVPLDCVEPRQEVLDYAVELAKQHDGELILLYVVENPVFPVEMRQSENFPKVGCNPIRPLLQRPRRCKNEPKFG